MASLPAKTGKYIISAFAGFNVYTPVYLGSNEISKR
jgi:hypothetical protein